MRVLIRRAPARPFLAGFVLLAVAAPGLIAKVDARVLAGLRPAQAVAAVQGVEITIDLSLAEDTPDVDRRMEALSADAAGVVRLVVVEPGLSAEGMDDRAAYNRWLGRIHRLAATWAQRVDVWAMRFPASPAAGPFWRGHTLFSQVLKSSATELRASDRDGRVLWWREPGAGGLDDDRARWPEGASAYLDGVIVPDATNVREVRGILPRADFEIWLAAPESARPGPAPAILARLMDLESAGVQVLLWRLDDTDAAGVTAMAPLIRETIGPDWSAAEGITLQPPSHRQGRVLVDAARRRVRVVLTGAGSMGADSLSLGVGLPSAARFLAPLSRATGTLKFHGMGADLQVSGIPDEPVVIVDLADALPLMYEASSTASSELSGEEVVARSEAFGFWQRRQMPQLACRLGATWQIGNEIGSLDADLLYESATSTAWIQVLSERKQGLPFDPNRERFLFFERGGGVATPLVQAVDEDHIYRRLADVLDGGHRRIAVSFEPKPAARKRTRGTVWLDPESFAMVRLEVDNPEPGFPLTHRQSTTVFQPLAGGLWLPSSTDEIDTGSILGFGFTGKSRLELTDIQVRPPDIPARVLGAMASKNPILVWNEKRDQLVVLRKSSGHRASPRAPDALVGDDYLMKLAFGQGLETARLSGAGAGAEADGANAAGTGVERGRSPTELDRLSREVGGVELLRGGDPKRLGGWVAGLGVASGRFAPVGLYTRVWLDWLGRRDWQLAVLTAGVFSVVRWTDAHLAGTRWSGSVTAILPLFPGPESTYGRGKDSIDAQKLRHWAPGLELSARTDFGERFGLEAGMQESVQSLRQHIEHGARLPCSAIASGEPPSPSSRASSPVDLGRRAWRAGLAQCVDNLGLRRIAAGRRIQPDPGVGAAEPAAGQHGRPEPERLGRRRDRLGSFRRLHTGRFAGRRRAGSDEAGPACASGAGFTLRRLGRRR